MPDCQYWLKRPMQKLEVCKGVLSGRVWNGVRVWTGAVEPGRGGSCRSVEHQANILMQIKIHSATASQAFLQISDVPFFSVMKHNKLPKRTRRVNSTEMCHEGRKAQERPSSLTPGWLQCLKPDWRMQWDCIAIKAISNNLEGSGQRTATRSLQQCQQTCHGNGKNAKKARKQAECDVNCVCVHSYSLKAILFTSLQQGQQGRRVQTWFPCWDTAARNAGSTLHWNLFETCRHSSTGCGRTPVHQQWNDFTVLDLLDVWTRNSLGPQFQLSQDVSSCDTCPKCGRAVWFSTTSCIAEPLCFNFVHFDLQLHDLQTALKRKEVLQLFWVQPKSLRVRFKGKRFLLYISFKKILHGDVLWYLVSLITGEDGQYIAKGQCWSFPLGKLNKHEYTVRT